MRGGGCLASVGLAYLAGMLDNAVHIVRGDFQKRGLEKGVQGPFE